MTEFKFEELSKKPVAQLRKIAEGMEHEALQDHAKMPKGELLAALCQALGIEAGKAPAQESVEEKETPAQEGTEEEAAPAEVSAKEKEAPAEESAEQKETPAEESAEEKETPAQESTEKEATPAEVSAKEKEAPAQESAEEKEAPAEESAAAKESAASEPSPAVVVKEKSKLKVQIRELKAQRDAALEAHDHAQLKAIRRRIRTLKRNVRRIAV